MAAKEHIEIHFHPSAKQAMAWDALMHNDDVDYVGYGGSAFSGKSYMMCYWLTIMCLSYPDTAWGLGRNQITQLKKTTLTTLWKVFKESNIREGIDYKYNQEMNTITFLETGSIIYLIDMAHKPSDPEYTRFGGFELTGAAIDESAEAPEKAISILSTRIGRRNNKKHGIKAKILETFNPDKGHVYVRYHKPDRDGQMPKNRTFIRALPQDNPSPEVEEYVRRIMQSEDNTMIERLIYGNFDYDDDPLKMIDYEAILRMFEQDESLTKGGKRYITADIAYEGSDKFVAMVWDDFCVSEIIVKEKINELNIGTFLHKLRTTYRVSANNMIYDADGLRMFVRESAKTGYLRGVSQFKNNSKALNGENYYDLKSQCAFHLKKHIESGLIGIDKSPDKTGPSAPKNFRKQIVEELEQLRKMSPKDYKDPLRIEMKADLKRRLGRSPDFMDNFIMRMWFEITKKKSNFSSIAGNFV